MSVFSNLLSATFVSVIGCGMGKFKQSRLYSVIYFKCPRCHEGEFFTAHPYNLKEAGNIHKSCSHCGVNYSKEPGFYYGAMYVSYALGVALFVMMWLLTKLFLPSISTGLQLFLIIAPAVLLSPYLYALSKIIWANFFIGYEGGKIKSTDH